MEIDQLIVFPVHLFSLEHLKNLVPKVHTIHLVEDPIYFGLASKVAGKRVPMKFNRLKLIYVRATMKAYQRMLKECAPSIKVYYHDFTNCKKYNFVSLAAAGNILAFDPVDYEVEAKLKRSFPNIILLETPGFLDTRRDLELYHTKINKNKTFYHAAFYKWQKEHLAIKELISEASHDTENRMPLPPSGIEIPPMPQPFEHNKRDLVILLEAKEYVRHHFPKAPSGHKQVRIVQEGFDEMANDDIILFPITHEMSSKWLDVFCRERFKHFGIYEDAIDSTHNFLYHSAISPMLNIGLLTPAQVLAAIRAHGVKSVGIANYEGFVRQLIGWREYQRYIYLYAYDKITSSNFFDAKRKLTPAWYSGTTGLLPLDTAINMAFRDGYLHHIMRLMIVGNAMNLMGVSPIEAYRWFMEFSLDSYDWVMIGNVYSMALWADGGLTMRKPYISSDAYLVKMSNFDKRGEWRMLWRSLFYNFIEEHQDKLSKTYYAGIVKVWLRRPEEEKKEILAIARRFISVNTS